MSGAPRYLAGNCLWTAEGTVVAVWRVNGVNHARLSEIQQLAWFTACKGAMVSLPGSWTTIEAATPVDPAEVVTAMVDGVDVSVNREWAATALDTLDGLAAARLFRRESYLLCELPVDHRRGFRDGLRSFTDKFSKAPPPPGGEEVAGVRERSSRLGRSLGLLLGSESVSEATPEEILWLGVRAALRGTSTEPTRPTFTGAHSPGPNGATMMTLTLPHVVEAEIGGRTDRRVLAVTSEDGTTYQTFAVVAETPEEWFFPAHRPLLERLDDLDFPVDVIVRVKSTDSFAAQGGIKRKKRELENQFEQYAGDSAGPPPSLSEALAALEHEQAELAATGSNRLRALVTLALGAETPDELALRVDQLRDVFKVDQYSVPRPPGQQRALWRTTQVGGPAVAMAGSFEQFLLPPALAGLGLWRGQRVGDDRGGLVAVNVDAAGHPPVLFCPSSGPSLPPPKGPRSGSFGVVGDLGSGKSFFVKYVAVNTVRRGGRCCCTDRTAEREYARIADWFGDLGQVVQLSGEQAGRWSLDLLRVLSGDEAVNTTTGFITLLTGTAPTEPGGAAVRRAVKAVQREGGGMDRIHAALLADGSPYATDVAEILSIYLDSDLARIVFDPTVPPVSVTGRFIVFALPGLVLPSGEQLADRRQLNPEHVFGSALVYATTAISRHIAFSTPEFCLVVADEAHVYRNPQGKALLEGLVLEGRRARAGVAWSSQRPSHMGDPGLVSLLGSRFAFRVDPGAARECLEFVGADPSPKNLQAISEGRLAGQGFYSDGDGTVALIQVLQPRDEALREAMRTDTVRAPA